MKKNNKYKGRRPKEGTQVKGISHTIRFSVEEDNELTERIKVFGGTRSDFIREAVFNSKVISIVPKEAIQILSSYEMNLRNIGTNLNSIAKKANDSALQFCLDDLYRARSESRSFLQECTNLKNYLLKK